MITLKSTAEYKQITIDRTMDLLATTAEGLPESEAVQRRNIFGMNEITPRKRNPVILFLLRFWGPMPWLLEAAVILSCILQRYLEAGIIAALILTNAIIGYYHNRGAQKSLELLKSKLSVKSTALRPGRQITVDSRDLVPGDIVIMSMGDIVPADVKIVSGSLLIDQSILTGESVPVEIAESGTLYSSSIVKKGSAKCVVLNTGKNTYFGKTVELVEIASPKSHQEEIMATIVKYMLYLGIAALLLVSTDALLTGADLLVILTFAVIFLLGAVPVALPSVMTIVQAVGATQLSEKGILVTRLNSIEDAASMDILCLDKTGTITLNELSINEVKAGSTYTARDVITMAFLTVSNDSKDMIDLVIKRHAQNLTLDLSDYQQISISPFDPGSKQSSAVVIHDNKEFKIIKGAPQIVISCCTLISEPEKEAIVRKVTDLSQKGYRTLAISRADDSDLNEMHFVGLIAISDPPRVDARKMIIEVKSLGVKPLMITGDNIAIAKEIANVVEIGSNLIRMPDLKNLSDAEQIALVSQCDGLAEVYPEDKYQIVKLLQSGGHMVGMTGDGVNDAPALKQAEVGIAVSLSTDVAKASASMVLTEPGIGVIVDAIKTSRQIYQRMLTWVINKITKTVQIIGLLTLGYLWLHDLVISLIGMTLLVFANDFVTMAVATDNVKCTGNPNKWNVKNITFASSIVGIFLIIEGFLALLIGRDYFHLPYEQLLSFILLILVFTSQFRIYIVRERRHFWDSMPGRELLIATIVTIIAFALSGIFGFIITRLTFHEILFILAFSALFTFAIDYPKIWAFKKFGL